MVVPLSMVGTPTPYPQQLDPLRLLITVQEGACAALGKEEVDGHAVAHWLPWC